MHRQEELERSILSWLIAFANFLDPDRAVFDWGLYDTLTL